jgi:hypothetical protein
MALTVPPGPLPGPKTMLRLPVAALTPFISVTTTDISPGRAVEGSARYKGGHVISVQPTRAMAIPESVSLTLYVVAWYVGNTYCECARPMLLLELTSVFPGLA